MDGDGPASLGDVGEDVVKDRVGNVGDGVMSLRATKQHQKSRRKKAERSSLHVFWKCFLQVLCRLVPNMSQNYASRVPKCIKSDREGGLVAFGALVSFWTSKKCPPRILFGSSWAPLGRFGLPCWRPLDFEGVPKSTFFAQNSDCVKYKRSPQKINTRIWDPTLMQKIEVSEERTL